MSDNIQPNRNISQNLLKVYNLIINENTTLDEVNNIFDAFFERVMYLEPLLKNMKQNNLTETNEFKIMFKEYTEISICMKIMEKCGTREADM
jgi:hypothetical protein